MIANSLCGELSLNPVTIATMRSTTASVEPRVSFNGKYLSCPEEAFLQNASAADLPQRSPNP